MLAYPFALLERAKAELQRMKGDNKGVTALEYGVIAAGIVVALAVSVTALSGGLSSTFTKITSSL